MSLLTSKKLWITLGCIALYVVLSVVLLGGYHLDAHNGTVKGVPNFSPIDEFDLTHSAWKLPKWEFGGIDLTITKAVLYLITTMLICTIFAVRQARKMQPRPGRTQTFTETIYDFSFANIARSGLTERTFTRYGPFIASLFVFFWVLNVISFLPLPFNSEFLKIHGHNTHIPMFGIYAAASNINVTLILTLVTISAMHWEGAMRHRYQWFMGPGIGRKIARIIVFPVAVWGWAFSWAPNVGEGTFAKILQVAIWPLEALGMMLRIVSLSVRIFANMLAGHTLILMFLALPAITGAAVLGPFTVLPALAFFLFELGLVASLQAYIFAMLSGIYIGTAAEEAH